MYLSYFTYRDIMPPYFVKQWSKEAINSREITETFD